MPITQEELIVEPALAQRFENRSKGYNLLHRSTQRRLLNLCKEKDQRKQLFIWLFKQGVPVTQTLAEIKGSDFALAVRFLKSGAPA
jgi:hypothetical protein